jgi:hypothetical protein
MFSAERTNYSVTLGSIRWLYYFKGAYPEGRREIADTYIPERIAMKCLSEWTAEVVFYTE